MASLPGGDADGSGGGGRTAAAGATASASAGVLPPFSASPSLAGFMHQPQQQVPLPLQLPSLGLQQPMLQLHGLAGGGGGAAAAVPSNYFTLPMLQQQAVPGAGAGSGVQMQMQGFPLGAPLGSLSLGWPLGGCDGGGALPPASSGVLPPSVPQPGALHQHVPQDLQQALSAPQIMSNTDHNGSTEGTQAWGGGARGRGSGGALEADESAAAESRLKSGGGGGARRGGEHRKSKFRWALPLHT